MKERSMSRVFITATVIAGILGCFLAYVITVGVGYVACSILIVSGIVVLVRKNAKMVLVCSCCIAALLGYMRVTLPAQQHTTPLETYYKEKVQIEGFVRGDIEHKNTRSRYVVTTNYVQGLPTKKNTRVLVYEPYPTACVSGEGVSFSATLKEPEDFITTTGRVFRYKHYLQQLHIYAIAHTQESGCTRRREKHAIFARARKRFMDAIHSFLPTEEATLLGGLLLGLRGAMSTELLEAFRATGLLHIIVLSGYNITLLAEAIRRLCARMPAAVRFVAPLAIIVLFTLLAGAQIAAVRAGSMATIALVARTIHREYDGIQALLLVAGAMVMFNPDQVLFSTSFHLSFLATMGLLLFTSPIERKLKKIPKKFGICGIVAATIATQISILPYLAYAIGEVSLIGIPANSIITPFIPLAMLFGAITIGIALIIPALAIAISPIAYMPLKIITTLAETMATLPHATLPLPEIGGVMMAATTALLLYVGYRQTQKQQESKVTHTKASC